MTQENLKPYNPIKAFQEARATGIRGPIDHKKNFIDITELSSFLQDSCGTCLSNDGCSYYPTMQRNMHTCEIDSKRCNLSFPGSDIKRVEDNKGPVECSLYKLRDDNKPSD